MRWTSNDFIHAGDYVWDGLGIVDAALQASLLRNNAVGSGDCNDSSRTVIMRGMLSILCVAVGSIHMLCCCYILTISVSVHWRD